MIPLVAKEQNEMQYYTLDQLSSLDMLRIPKHIAIIPDGNRRWAKKREATAQEGHREGADILMDIVKAAKELSVEVITFYTFSTENWNRSESEIASFMFLIASYLSSQREEMIRCGIQLHTIGNLTQLPGYVQRIVEETKKATASCSKINLVLALNYGGRDDIKRAVHSILDDYQSQKLKKEDVTEAMISRYLDTSPWTDPELLIRASGELRISNFLLWQLSYSEIHVTPVLWPDFTPQHLLEAVRSYQNRERRLGGP